MVAKDRIHRYLAVSRANFLRASCTSSPFSRPTTTPPTMPKMAAARLTSKGTPSTRKRASKGVPAASAAAAPKATTLIQNDLTIDTERYEVRRGDELVPLTPVEFKLLVTLVAADGRALTRDQLLDAVYGSDDGDVLDRTIDVHVGRLREKLNDDAENPLYVMTVRGVGYRAAPQVTEA